MDIFSALHRRAIPLAGVDPGMAVQPPTAKSCKFSLFWAMLPAPPFEFRPCFLQILDPVEEHWQSPITESPPSIDKKYWCILNHLAQSSMGARTLNLGDSVFLYISLICWPVTINVKHDMVIMCWLASIAWFPYLLGRSNSRPREIRKSAFPRVVNEQMPWSEWKEDDRPIVAWLSRTFDNITQVYNLVTCILKSPGF